MATSSSRFAAGWQGRVKSQGSRRLGKTRPVEGILHPSIRGCGAPATRDRRTKHREALRDDPGNIVSR